MVARAAACRSAHPHFLPRLSLLSYPSHRAFVNAEALGSLSGPVLVCIGDHVGWVIGSCSTSLGTLWGSIWYCRHARCSIHRAMSWAVCTGTRTLFLLYHYHSTVLTCLDGLVDSVKNDLDRQSFVQKRQKGFFLVSAICARI